MFLDLLRKKLKQKDLYHYDEKSNAKEIEIKKQQIGSNIHHTISIFEKIYSIPTNKDVNIREFNIGSLNKKAAILAITSITNSNAIDEYVLVPLLTNKDSSKNIADILEISDVSTFHISALNIDVLTDFGMENYAENVQKREGLKKHLEEQLTIKFDKFIKKTQEEFKGQPFGWSLNARKHFLTIPEYKKIKWMKTYPNMEINIAVIVEFGEFGRQSKLPKLKEVRD